MFLRTILPLVLGSYSSSGSSPDALLGGMGLMMILAFGCFIFLVILAIQIFILYTLQNCLKRIPQQYRQQEPAMVWLLLIPFFNLVWNFFIWPKIAASFKAYFDAQGRTDVGDCGGSLALALCICAVCGIIPYLGACISIATLVLLILVLVKFVGYQNEIPEGAAGTLPAPGPQA